MGGKIFVNYRRDDGAANAARLCDRLAGVFGTSNVFMDVDNLLAGQRFDKELEKALAQTDVFLAVIGPRWMELLKSRADGEERDYVREEIAGALKRGVLVIPVLIERATLPRGVDLPEDIRDLVLHQKHDIAHEHFGRDAEALIAAIGAARKAMMAGSGGGRLMRWHIVAAGLVAVILGAGALAYQNGLEMPLSLGTEAKLTAKAESEEVKRKAEEAERQRLAMLKAEEDKKRAAAAEAKAKADAEAKRKAEEVERLRLAAAKAEEERKQAEAVRQAAETAKAKAEKEARDKAETERQRQSMIQQEVERKRAKVRDSIVADSDTWEAQAGYISEGYPLKEKDLKAKTDTIIVFEISWNAIIGLTSVARRMQSSARSIGGGDCAYG